MLQGNYDSSFASFIARPMSMGLNFSLPCMAAIWALSFFSRIFTKSSLLTRMVILDAPSWPGETQPSDLVRSSVHFPPPSPEMSKWMMALMSLPSSGLDWRTVGISVSMMSFAVMTRSLAWSLIEESRRVEGTVMAPPWQVKQRDASCSSRAGAAHRGRVQRATHHLQQVVQLEGLGQVADSANVLGLAAHVAVRAEDDERDGRDGRRLLAHALGELPAVHHRHHQVQQDELRRVRLQLVQRLLAVAGAADLEALGLQDLRERFEDVRVIIDDEHRAGTSHGGGRRGGRRRGRGGQ